MRARLVAGLLLASTGLLATSACANPYPQVSPLPTPLETRAPVTQAPDASPSAPGTEQPDELVKGGVRHTVRSNGLTVGIDYAAPVPAQWTSDAGTSLQVTVSVHNDRRPKQKIYLTRATVRVVVSDGSSYLPSPDPLIETANLSPGYLATSPYGYVQSFSVPGLDQSAQDLVLSVKLDLVSLVDGKARDYTKTSITDSVRTVARA
jgi:hypothetical protein